MTEAKLQRLCLDYLARLPGVWACHIPNSAMKNRRLPGSVKGAPDIVASVSGRSVWLELKAPGGKASPEQIAVGVAIAEAGGIYRICQSLDDVRAAIAEARA